MTKPPYRVWCYLLPILLVGLWGIMIGQAVFYGRFPRTPLVTLVPAQVPFLGTLTGGIYLYREGFYYGAVQGLRFVATVSLGVLVGSTTDPRHLLSGLMSLGIPYPLAFIVSVALRYIPNIAEEAQIVYRSQRLRGLRIWHVNPVTTAASLLKLAKPILIRNARRAGSIADTIQCRGFSPELSTRNWKRSALHPIHLGLRDWLVISSLSAVTVGCLAAKLVYFVYLKGFFYQPWLRPLYEIAQRLI